MSPCADGGGRKRFAQFACVALHATPSGRVVSRETSFHEQFFDIPI